MEIRRLQNKADEDNGSNGFNILKYTAPESSIISLQSMHWTFCVDRSGSMSTISSKDNKTRLYHVKATLVRIVEYLKNLCNGTSRTYIIDIVWFNGDIKTSSITIDGMTDTSAFIKEINDVTAYGMTNMSAAIRKASQLILEHQSDLKTTMVVLSDGEITTGISDPQYIREFVDECYIKFTQNFTPVFVGYGTEQSSSLLSSLSNTPNGEYHCVESVEGAGIVYGEIVHSALYECIKDMKIDVLGYKIYDFEKNTWNSSLTVGKIASGASRVWHLRESRDENPSGMGQAKASFNQLSISDDGDSWSQCILTTANAVVPEIGTTDRECYRYYLRQQVLELLAESKEYIQNMHNLIRRNTPPPAPRLRRQVGNNISPLFEVDSSQDLDIDLFEPPPTLSPIRFNNELLPSPNVETLPAPSPRQLLKQRLIDKMNEIKAYIVQDGDDTGILGTLCDDLYVCSMALKSSRGLTYILARQTSQGNQRAYNALGVDDLEDDTDMGHQMSDNMVSPYASQQASDVIRGVSQPM